ncbi:ribosome biogenesis GTPase RsgA [Acetobacterium bakii]|uniref:Small ribosomal subunit biogenesis GTPase RsgA n=1 Tax=Acetobacterium bakii TaxID=52689 RepID=A0A0L6U2I7_9FIRM|nr:ribosome biogenesis GTPase RsgA [Acetobacterium bakii]
MKKLEAYGFTQNFKTEASRYSAFIPGRIISQSRDLYKVVTDQGEFFATLSGKFRHEANHLEEFPAVGDFVMLDRSNNENGNGIIHHVLTRKSSFERTAVGFKNEVQIVAANIDIVFICMSLNNDYNLSRLERYLSVAWNSGAVPVVVLTKADLCKNVPQKQAEIGSIALGADIVTTSSQDAASIDMLLPFIRENSTAAFIGSSGVGKSTLINCLAGKEILVTREIRQDDKGRHASTRRELILLPKGGVLIDTPGMRELGVDSVDLRQSFSDIDTLATQCRFKDCAHKKEPGCAVRSAVADGSLDPRRFENYIKLKKEARYEGLNSRQIEAEKTSEMFKDFGGVKNVRKIMKEKNKRGY